MMMGLQRHDDDELRSPPPMTLRRYLANYAAPGALTSGGVLCAGFRVWVKKIRKPSLLACLSTRRARTYVRAPAHISVQYSLTRSKVSRSNLLFSESLTVLLHVQLYM